MALTLPLRARAPAKVNLCLYVGQRRGDGLHEICSLFQSVTLADVVTMEAASGSDEVVCAGVTGENLALRALERFRSKFGLDEPAIRITISKQIPVAAGLGGGSADAAAVLRICASIRGLDSRELRDLAMSLGADVPSQLEPGTRLVTGGGEKVESFEPPAGLSLLLVMNRRGLSTADVYARADELGPPDRDLDPVAEKLREQARVGEPTEILPLLHNDLQVAALGLEPTAGQALELLYESGAERALISGSGPTAFGVFSTPAQAEEAASALSPRWEGPVRVVQAVAPGYAATASFSGSGQ